MNASGEAAPALLERAAAEAQRRYPPNRVVDDAMGETGQAQSDEYGYQECARRAFLAGAEWAVQQSSTT